ncbi:hypothetical protein [Paenibacillus solani]|uniref:Uncharacterized protein n=1 Tax=Paenibacillus solani TaxID=1705565 RepID=A0A0M1N3L0_9BACL|nr:hypothetical protein [Paenibacillus solani]KOR76743.1 hypothetical protein AM231_22620 [Paenibacillus solani]
MKHKLFGKLALSAVLLGSAALPVHASGADTPSDVPNQTGKSAPLKTTATISILPNPLELAEKYTPETVQDWKETLEKYGKLAGAEGAFFFSEATTVIAGEMKPVVAEGEFEVSVALKTSPAKDIQELIDSGDIKEFKATQIKDVITPLEGITLGRAEIVNAESGEVKYDVIQDEAASFTAVKISDAASLEVKINDEDLAFIHARIDLFKAVDSKDSDSIKMALTKLLDQYKEQIAKLEAEAK